MRTIQRKEAKDVEDKTFILADIAEKALAQMLKAFVKTIVIENMDEETAERVATVLTEGRWTHDYPIALRRPAASASRSPWGCRNRSTS